MADLPKALADVYQIRIFDKQLVLPGHILCLVNLANHVNLAN